MKPRGDATDATGGASTTGAATGAAATRTTSVAATGVGEVALVTHELCRRFGGLMAVRNVSIELRRGTIHAVLGPNGAGKSTLINLLSGDLAATSGTVLYGGRDITRLSPDRRSRLGIGRSYQKTNIFPQFTAYENCRLAAQSRTPRAWHVLENAARLPGAREAAERSLDAAGLAARAGAVASTLSHGEQRQLEIAMVLATSPDVLLLDEPLAGMGAEEALRMVELLQRLAPDHATLLVEHDMDAVFALADVITVMVNGEVLESGLPDAIRASPAVRQAYLPDDAVAEGADAAGGDVAGGDAAEKVVAEGADAAGGDVVEPSDAAGGADGAEGSAAGGAGQKGDAGYAGGSR